MSLPQVIDRFWNTFRNRIPTDARIVVTPIELDSIRNAFNKPIEVPYPAYLFFVDIEPEANWGHRCAYVFVSTAGDTAWVDEEWPPNETVLQMCLEVTP